jgi:hypothetical protein
MLASSMPSFRDAGLSDPRLERQSWGADRFKQST